MKVLIRLNHGLDKSLLLDLKESVPPKKVRKILDSADQERAIQQLLADAAHVQEIPPQDKMKAQSLADFVMGPHGSVTERLA